MGNIPGVLNLLQVKTLPFPVLWLGGGFWLDTHQEADLVLGNRWAVQNLPEESNAANRREKGTERIHFAASAGGKSESFCKEEHELPKGTVGAHSRKLT